MKNGLIIDMCAISLKGNSKNYYAGIYNSKNLLAAIAEEETVLNNRGDPSGYAVCRIVRESNLNLESIEQLKSLILDTNKRIVEQKMGTYKIGVLNILLEEDERIRIRCINNGNIHLYMINKTGLVNLLSKDGIELSLYYENDISLLLATEGAWKILERDYGKGYFVGGNMQGMLGLQQFYKHLQNSNICETTTIIGISITRAREE